MYNSHSKTKKKKTYKSTADDDTEAVVLGVTDDIIAGHERCPLVKVPHHHVFLLELKIVHHVLAIRVEADEI